MQSIVRVREAHVPYIHSRAIRVARIGFVDETIDALSDSVPIDLGSDTLEGSADLEEWSSQVEEESVAASEDVATIEEDAKKTGKPAAAPKPAPSGSSVVALKAVQSALKQLGYDLGPAGVDGIIGKYTRAAIVKFKKDHGISPANATIDANFRKALDAALKAKVKPTTSPAAASAGGSGGLFIAVIAAAVAIGAYYFFKKV